nr:MAG TPA: hypothetical protein [Caudoviricetes sp.]
MSKYVKICYVYCNTFSILVYRNILPLIIR